MDVKLFSHSDGEPWAVWTDGHRMMKEALPEINKELANNNYKPVEYLVVEYGFVKKVEDDEEAIGEEYTLTFCREFDKGSMPVTFVKGQYLEII
tara:strand:+ start:90 stop:371 length:282 start_codon:yes stop_codon:yes gene_type:complete